MSSNAGAERKKAKILRWRGVLDSIPRMVRIMVAAVLAVASIAITFTQFGFVEITLPDGTVAYIVTLLPVVTLGALLLGTFWGTALGLVTGTVLLLHAYFLPLNHYEMAFVTPFSSVFLLGFSGLLLGVLFAFALRNGPTRWKRAIYIVIVCALVSLFHSVGFGINVFVQLIAELASTMGDAYDEAMVRELAAKTTMQLGDMATQGQSTALIMVLNSLIGDFAARRALRRKGSLGLRSVFGAWLAVVVTLAFMIMSALSFASATLDELKDADEVMKGDVEYLCGQFEDSDVRIQFVSEFLEQIDFDVDALGTETVKKLETAFSESRLLNGYEVKSDGTVLVLFDKYVYLSNDERFPSNSFEENDALAADLNDAIDASRENGHIQRFVFNEADTPLARRDGVQPSESRPQIAYLFAGDAHIGEASPEGYDLTIVEIRTSEQVFEKRFSVMVWMTLSSLVLLLAVFFIVFQLLNRVVAQRIDEENKALALITEGKLDARAEAGGTVEFESLSNGINSTVDALKGWIAEAEMRMDAELATAKAIQKAALPRIFPPFPDILKFDIYASMDAAREVGGDFYDFFLIGDDCDAVSGKLGFVVADVSGKGVPAALFMMKAKALIRDYVSSGLELGEAVTEANAQLVDGNGEDMFVTTWVGVLDYGTGHVDYVNAGHNPPLIWQREGGWQWMREKSGPPLGLFELPYNAYSVECEGGDMLLLYTDGVTEAFDVDGKLYGEKQLLQVAEDGFRLHPRELLEAVRADVARHAEGAEQSDDITILSLEVGVPPEVTATLEVPAKVEQLDRVNRFLHAELDQRLCSHRVQNQLDIAVEELFVNVCHYAYPNATPDEPGFVRVQRTYSADPPSVIVDIIDEGIPYDPLAKPDAVTPENIEDVPIGGLGILMAKRSVNEIHYERADDCNVVTIIKKW